MMVSDESRSGVEGLMQVLPMLGSDELERVAQAVSGELARRGCGDSGRSYSPFSSGSPYPAAGYFIPLQPSVLGNDMLRPVCLG